ncbi:hypothetical protein CFC35_39885 [Streptomyces sp. FBKL.4005]|nr:hypothetical protein CFC35_39885 [Streptomyces sp. FBKL.4005]
MRLGRIGHRAPRPDTPGPARTPPPGRPRPDAPGPARPPPGPAVRGAPGMGCGLKPSCRTVKTVAICY